MTHEAETSLDRWSVRETLSGKQLLLSGSTGFLGKVWLVLLLEECDQMGTLHLLIRGRKGESAETRFWKMVYTSPAFRRVRAKFGDRLQQVLAQRVRVVEGDASQVRCGLSESQHRRLAERLDAVVHFAGVTDFEPDPRLAFEGNVRSLQRVAELAARSRGRRLIQISTSFVAGNVSGEVRETLTPGVAPTGARFNPDDEIDALAGLCRTVPSRGARIVAANERAQRLGWPNIYTYTKALAEHWLGSQGSPSELRWCIVRPSVVEGALERPLAGWNEGINTSGPLVWLLRSAFRRFPSNPDHRFDVVPVDIVASVLTTIVASMIRDPSTGVYQVGSSHSNPLTFGRAIDLTALAARRMHGRPSASVFERWVVRHLDAVPADADGLYRRALPAVRGAAKGLRGWLGRTESTGAAWLPPALYDRIGPTLETKSRAVSSELRNLDRRLARIEELLRLYRPFIYDNDYVFCVDRTRTLCGCVAEEEQKMFGFHVDTIDWRVYWLDVHVPGLERWCLPLLQGQSVPTDPMPRELPRFPRNEGTAVLPNEAVVEARVQP